MWGYNVSFRLSEYVTLREEVFYDPYWPSLFLVRSSTVFLSKRYIKKSIPRHTTMTQTPQRTKVRISSLKTAQNMVWISQTFDSIPRLEYQNGTLCECTYSVGTTRRISEMKSIPRHTSDSSLTVPLVPHLYRICTTKREIPTMLYVTCTAHWYRWNEAIPYADIVGTNPILRNCNKTQAGLKSYELRYMRDCSYVVTEIRQNFWLFFSIFVLMVS